MVGAQRLVNNVPANMNMVLIREEYLAVCNGDACAAALLNWFERYAMYRKGRGWQEWGKVTAESLSEKMLGAFSARAIKRGLKLLRDCGLVKMRQGTWDRHIIYAFDVERVQDAISAVFDAATDTDSCAKNERIDLPKTNGSICQNRTDRSAENAQIDPPESSASTLEDQVVKQEAFDQESFDQEATAANNAAAANESSPAGEKASFEKTFEALSARLACLTTPPRSATPPSPTTVIEAFERDFGACRPTVRLEIAEAVAAHGEAVVLAAITASARAGGRSWAYVATKLPKVNVKTAAAWNESADMYDWIAQRESERAALAALTPHERAWAETRRLIELQAPEDYRLWWQEARLARVEGDVYVIGVGNKWTADYLQKQAYRSAKRNLQQFAANADIRFEVQA